MERLIRLRGDDGGSVLLLTLGYAALALTLVLVCVDATSLYLAQKRLDAAADAVALAGADGFVLEVDGGQPRAVLTDSAVWDEASIMMNEFDEISLVSAVSPDGISARVTVSARWRAPVLTLFVPEGVELESSATSRTAFG